MRLVDADELKKKAYPFPCAIGIEYAVTIRVIDDAPTVEPIKQGEFIWFAQEIRDPWGILSYEEGWVCSKCDHMYDGYGNPNKPPTNNFCPNCGTSMRTKN